MSADPEFAPFAWHDGQALRGASVDVLIAVLKALKLPHGLRYAGPFSRFLVEAQSGRVDIITECRRNPEREAFRLGARGRLSQNKTLTRTEIQRRRHRAQVRNDWGEATLLAHR